VRRQPRPHPATVLPILPDVELTVGDVVVYGNHGIGRVVARRTQEMLGERREVVVLQFEELTVTLPFALARTELRPLANEADIGRVSDALQADEALNSRNWLARRREATEKLVGGTPVELAEIVSEGAQRKRLRSARVGKSSQFTLSERDHYAKARTLLSDEIAMALDIKPAEAETWIDGHLMRPGSASADRPSVHTKPRSMS
jgi:RNA polymerase-interacting CarD/CdnL/TRCF family regulator